MNDLQLYVKTVMAVLQGLKCECAKYEGCPMNCKLYNKEYATCLLRAYPCDYDLQVIENRLTEIIQDEMKKDGENK